MGIFKKKPATRVTREQILLGRPVRNPNLEEVDAEDGEVSLRRPRRKVWWLNLLAKLGRVPEYHVLTLDRVGSSVWALCDGEHTVADIVERLAEEHQLSRKEAEVSMMTYLRQLAQRGVIALVIESEEESETK